jgi:hypothetical protein
MSINKGYFEGIAYVKIVDFNKAVLWKTKELSVPMTIMDKIKLLGISEMRFVDWKKKQQWNFDAAEVAAHGKEKQVGQEPQWYFPIGLATKVALKGGEQNNAKN